MCGCIFTLCFIEYLQLGMKESYHEPHFSTLRKRFRKRLIAGSFKSLPSRMALEGRASQRLGCSGTEFLIIQLHHEKSWYLETLADSAGTAKIEVEFTKNRRYIGRYLYIYIYIHSAIEDILLICPAPGYHWMGPKWTYWPRFGVFGGRWSEFQILIFYLGVSKNRGIQTSPNHPF